MMMTVRQKKECYYVVILMYKIGIFVEDEGHRATICAVIERIGEELGVDTKIIDYNTTGGAGSAISELRQYVRDYQKGRVGLLDILVIGIDANCSGYSHKRREILDIVKELEDFCVLAVPDPHVEKWLLCDSSAFNSVFGVGCSVPAQKCQKGYYKKLLREAVRKANVDPAFGGIEYASELVNNMSLTPGTIADTSMDRFVGDLRSRMERLTREGR